MKNKTNAIRLLGVCVLCLLAFACCQTVVAADQPTVQVGIVAQRYPWNGMVDVKVKVAGVTAESGATLTVTATVGKDKVDVKTVTGVKNGEQTISFDANEFEALKGKKLNDVKITAKVA